MVKLTKEKINSIGDGCKNEKEFIVKLYEYVVPDWENVKIVKKWPAVSLDTWVYISDVILNKFNPGPGAGFIPFMWFNNGFSVRDNCKNWAVYTSKANIIYK